MLFNSAQFLCFFLVVVVIYYLIPKNTRNAWLLIASYYFYMSWNVKYVILLLFSTIVTYFSGVLIDKFRKSEWSDKIKTRRMKCCVVVSLVLNLSVLFFFKYFNFTIRNVNALLKFMDVNHSFQVLDILLPIGISFFTFQSLTYTIDVYRGKLEVERNFFRYALFVAFFPTISAGPIERAYRLLPQLKEPKVFDFNRLRSGLLLMLWGFFLKIVLADRIAIFVNTAYGNIEQYAGCFLIIATALFGIQILCDFAGYSTIALGVADILGFEVMDNFNTPYFSKSCGEFWRRWHISLSSWFRDYVYIPLGGNRKGTVRKYVNLMIVFALSGLWHGAEWTFIIWGCLNGLYQVAGGILKPVRDKLVKWLHLNRGSFGHHVLQIVSTFILVDFAWLFFKANNIEHAIAIVKSMFTVYNPWIFFDESLFTCGLDRKNFYVMIFSIIILFVVECFKYKGICIREKILSQDWWFRWVIYIAAIVFITVVGVWGSGYDVSGFIYFDF